MNRLVELFLGKWIGLQIGFAPNGDGWICMNKHTVTGRVISYRYLPRRWWQRSTWKISNAEAEFILRNWKQWEQTK